MAGKRIELLGLTKDYNGNVVLNIEKSYFECGHIYGLIGTNGAGKTTLLELISGTLTPSFGQVNHQGLSVEMIHHQAGLFQDMTIYENMFVGRERIRGNKVVRLLDWKKMKEEAAKTFDHYGLNMDVTLKAKELPTSVQKLVEIVIALWKEPDVLIIDEPLTLLDIEQVHQMNQLIQGFVNDSRMAIYSSHRWDELFKVVDRVVTMRDGKLISDQPATDSVLKGLLEFADRDTHKYPKRPIPVWPGLLEVRGLRTKHIKSLDFDLAKGEVLGIVGLKNAYKSEIGKALFGALPSEGHIRIEGSEKRIKNTATAVEAGICYIGSGKEGVFVEESVIDNVVSANVPRIRRLSRSAKQLVSKYYLDMLNVKADQIDQSVTKLSAGNQQKIQLAKWFFSKSKIFIFNKPTANVDAASKVDIYNIFADLAESGAGLILISNDLEEIAGLCDRVLVIEQGGIKEILTRKSLTVYNLVESLQNW